MKMTKISALFAAALITLTSCSSNTPGQELKTTVDDVGGSADESDTIINLGVVNFENYKYERELIEKFNSADNGYFIKAIDYAKLYDFDTTDLDAVDTAYSNAELQMINDLIRHNNIDMTLDMLGGDKVISLAQKGAFTDLNKFMENDPDFDRHELNEHVLDVCEMDDSLYYMPLGYMVNTMYGCKRFVGSPDDWIIDEMKARWNAMPAGSAFTREYITGGANAENIFFGLCMRCTSAFMDPATSRCSFDSEDYIDLLSFANSFETRDNSEKSDFAASEFFLAPADINGFDRFHEYFFNEGSPDDMSFVGYPSKDSSYSFLSLYGDCEICAKSPENVQKGAWEFMKMLVGEDIQYKSYFPTKDDLKTDNSDYIFDEINTNSGFPINNRAFMKRAEEVIATPAGTNMVGMGGQTYNVGSMTNEELAILEDVIARTENVEFGTYKLYNIISEEVTEMFAGARDAKSTAKMIQNRASILVSE